MKDELERIAIAMEKQTEMLSKMMEIIEEEHARSKAMAAEEAAHRAQFYDGWDKQVEAMAAEAKAKLFGNIASAFGGNDSNPYL